MNASIALLAAGALVFLSAAVQHLNTVGSKGLAFIFTDRATPLSREGFAGRAARTLQNNLESAGMVVPAAMVLLVAGVDSVVVTGAALIYAVTRAGFTLSYWAGISKLRSFFWGLGMAMIGVLTVNAMLTVLAR
ncbi:MAPEG family protein [Devosia sp. XJ19-1]|uniref:MAPEG family protein n=1 Tax=Devosia ureilytica TaxID=2952754 RepID=A0A9Q4AQ50_9HYPH|nr:MAPEG family protein [Devosia ureilytica]MCP8884187.1 MAPEG family protein [Devosia ureilytica]MCP8887795.1 MAPEG family protein [Devosia ureilytica]